MAFRFWKRGLAIFQPPIRSLLLEAAAGGGGGEGKKYGLWKMEKGEESKRINGGMANSLEKGRRKTLRVSHKSHFLVFSTRMPQQHQPFPRKKNNKKKKGETARGAGF